LASLVAKTRRIDGFLESALWRGYQSGMRREVFRFFAIAMGACAQSIIAPAAGAGPHDALVAKHAAANGVPEHLVQRVIKIESGGNAAATHAGNFGLMQIRLGTARALGYTGDPRGLLDPDTNLTYAVRYLAGAYRAAGCNEHRAVSYYQRGYYGTRPQDCGSAASPTIEIADAEAKPSLQLKPEAKPVKTARGRGTAQQKSESASPAADVIKPKVVRTEIIGASKSSAPPARPVGAFEPKRVPPPVQAAAAPNPDAAKPNAIEAASEPGAKMELASIPLPPARPEAASAPRHKVRQARHATGAPAHAGKTSGDGKDGDVISTVLTSLKKLVTPDKTPHKRPATLEAEMDPPTQVQPPQ
jgi:hypothetical protein